MSPPKNNIPASHSAAFFCAQAAAPDEDYLKGLHSFLSQNKTGKLLLREISDLNPGHLWQLFLEANRDVEALTYGLEALEALQQWAATGACGAVAVTKTGIVALPLLVIIQVGQYLRYLEIQDETHQEFLADIQDKGGLQGFCGGLATAIALACAVDEEGIIQHVTAALKVLIGVAAYGEAADDSKGSAATTLVVRLDYEGQGDEIVPCFPETYVSAVTGPLSISIVGPNSSIQKLYAYVRNEEQLQARIIDIRGKLHNPENTDIAAALCQLCATTPGLQLPDASLLQVPVRSNRTGQKLTVGSLTDELISTILASKSEWYTVLVETAKDLKATSVEPAVLSFGLTDAVSAEAFIEKGVRISKTFASGLITRIANKKEPTVKPELAAAYPYPDTAVAIIGASARLPGARNLEELWELLANGVDRHEPINSDRFDMYNSYRISQSDPMKGRKYYGNFIDGIDRFDNAFFGMNPREMLNLDPQQRMLLEAAYEALECSGYTHSHVRSRGDGVGCFIGASFIEYLENTGAYAPTAYTAPGTIRAFLCGRLSYHFGWTGPAEVIDTACSASLVAINRAVKAIQTGECSMALSGGVNLITGINNYLDLGRAGFLSTTGQCKPFDKDADGYCRADGVGLVVLKSLRQAQLDGDTIMGVIVGAATNQGGLSDGITVPSSDAQLKLYRSLLDQASMTPDQVTYVEAHGTGTQVGDPLEVASIRTVFGSSTRSTDLHIGSIKGNIGHCETAAGVAGVLKILCMLRHKSIPPLASHKVLNPKIPSLSPDRMAISTSLSSWDTPMRVALVNSYGAAGSNAAVLLGEFVKEAAEPKQSTRRSDSSSTWPIILSAKSTSSLKLFQDCLADYISKKNPDLHISSISRTLSERRQRHKFSVVLEASSTADLIKSLSLDQAKNTKTMQGSSRAAVLTFGGQSKQTIDLDKDLYETFPAFRSKLDLCDSIIQELGYPSIFPGVFATAPISDIVVLQTGFVAVQYAMAKTWIESGLKVDAVIGHSLGELTALAVSEKLSLRDCLTLVAGRADLMQTEWGEEKGSMLAVFSTRDVVKELIADKELEIACYNSDTSQVVSGETRAISELEDRLSSLSPPIKYLRVETSHAFHSRFVDPVLEKLDGIASSLQWKTPVIPIELCTESQSSPDATYSPSDHARQPVFLNEAVKRLEKNLGPLVFLEASMNTPIISMVKRAVSKPENHSFIAVSSKEPTSSFNLITRTVCSLWSSGLDVTHWHMRDAECEIDYAWLPPYQFDDTRAWLDHVDQAAVFESQLKRGVVLESQGQVQPDQPKMVKSLPDLETSSGKAKRFSVHVSGSRFSQITAAHAVRNRPLCPASLYLECVAMALDTLIEDLKASSLDFQDLEIQAPLGLDADLLEVTLEETITKGCWSFRVVSHKAKETLHAKGQVTLSSKQRTDATARVISNFMKPSLHDLDTERLRKRRVYNLFSRVVTYADILQGITEITITGTKAVATTMTAPNNPGMSESTVIDICDAVTLDSFIQVVGLLINTSDMVGEKDVMICNGIDSTIVASGVDLTARKSWKVYASYTAASPTLAVGDVFAFAEDGSFAASITGCRFSKLEITRLERLLDPSNKAPRAQPTRAPVQDKSIAVKAPDHSEIAVVQVSTSSEPVQSINIRQIIELFTGLSAADIADDTMLGDLGLDSIAAIEMAQELRSSHGITIEGPDLLNACVKQLEEMAPALEAKLSAPVIEASLIAPPVPITFEPAITISSPPQDTIRQILEIYTGLAAAEMVNDVLLGDLGLDSIAAIEMAEELQSTHKITIDGPELLNISLKQLEDRVYGSDSGYSDVTSSERSK